MIHADFPNSEGTLLIEKIQAVKHSGCQAIFDAKPTVFLTIANHYDHDVQKALLGLVNQVGDEREVLIESERRKLTSTIFSTHAHPKVELDADGNLSGL
jgi:hypothetical protein